MIGNKALADVTWADIEAVVASQTEESLTLEFKGGEIYARVDSKDQRSPKTIEKEVRDTVAKEIVAFANAYGGTVVIGVSENKDTPPCAAQISTIADVANKATSLEAALRSILDPPLAALQVRFVPSAIGASDGCILLRTPASLLAPHGFHKPPEAYVRQGASSMPMTMRDLQSVFWEARTRIERTRDIRNTDSKKLKELKIRKESGGLLDTNGTSLDSNVKGLFFRCLAIMHNPLIRKKNPKLRPQLLRPSLPANSSHLFGDGIFNSSPNPRASGIWVADSGPSEWDIDEDGTISVMGFGSGRNNPPNENGHHPGWYCGVVARVLIIMERLRRSADASDLPFEIDAEILQDGSAVGLSGNEFQFGRAAPMRHEILLRPLLVRSLTDIPEVYRELETQIWNGFGFEKANPMQIDFESAGLYDWPEAR